MTRNFNPSGPNRWGFYLPPARAGGTQIDKKIRRGNLQNYSTASGTSSHGAHL